jgi:hypothetical protein
LSSILQSSREDRLALDDPYNYAIKPGGEVFFALLNDEVVGCVAMVPKQRVKNQVVEFELAKMAVRTKSARSRTW